MSVCLSVCMSSNVTFLFLFLKTLSSRNLSHGINSNLEFAQITLVLFSHEKDTKIISNYPHHDDDKDHKNDHQVMLMTIGWVGTWPWRPPGGGRQGSRGWGSPQTLEQLPFIRSIIITTTWYHDMVSHQNWEFDHTIHSVYIGQYFHRDVEPWTYLKRC